MSHTLGVRNLSGESLTRGDRVVVGPGRLPWSHRTMLLIGDNEYGMIEYQGLRRQPRTQGDA
jgi:hypothetical protein